MRENHFDRRCHRRVPRGQPESYADFIEPEHAEHAVESSPKRTKTTAA